MINLPFSMSSYRGVPQKRPFRDVMKNLQKAFFSDYHVENGFWVKHYIRLLGVPVLVRKKFRGEEVDRRIANALGMACEVAKAPPARGLLRRLQLAELGLLKFFDAVCAQNAIPWYLCGGTLLGAYRHKGFIPWDDDVDVSIPKAFRPRLVKALQVAFEGTDFFLWGVDKSRWDATLRISHKRFQFLNLDIFYPYCFSDEAGDRETIRKGWEDAHKHYCSEYRRIHAVENEDVLDSFREETDAYYASRVRGMVDFFDPHATQFTTEIHWHDFRLIPMSALLPLGSLQFEDMVCPAPHDPLQYLKEHYDVFSFPSCFDHHGTAFQNFGEDEVSLAEREVEQLRKRGVLGNHAKAGVVKHGDGEQ